MRILTVVGARPQFIKAAPVSQILRRLHTEIVVHTGQHYDDSMSAIFFEELGLPRADFDLGVGSGPHGDQTGRMLQALEPVIAQSNADAVLVYGDTNSTLAGALVAAKLRMPVVHVEAGLRSFDRTMPEEVNRVLTDHLSRLLLCPTATAVDNVRREGIQNGVEMTGDVGYDAWLAAGSVLDGRSGRSVLPDRFALATIHRAENVDDEGRLRSILTGLGGAGMDVLLPVHPRTRAAIERARLTPPPNVLLTPPAGFFDMIRMELGAEVIVTDSGGVQKEAYFAGLPCVTVRDTTEWVETVTAGWNVLVGHDPAQICAAIREFRPSGERPALFGEGHASEQVVAAIETMAST